MTPEHRAAKQHLDASIKRWLPLVPPGLTLTHTFVEGVNHADPDILAETHALKWEYHGASIVWYLGAAASATEEFLDGTVVHELVHVLLAPIEEELPTRVGKLREWTVESVAQAILRIATP